MDHSMYLGAGESTPQSYTIVAGSWISEAALWSKWFHTGTALTADTCDLIILDAALFTKHAQTHISMKHIALEYAAHFLQRIVEASGTWPSDIEVAGTDYAEIVSSLAPDVRTRIGIDAITHLRSATSFHIFKHDTRLRELEEEVLDGRSILLQRRAGVVERIASVSVLRLSCEDGRLLYHIAKIRQKEILLVCKMTGTKVNVFEVPLLTARRLIEQTMPSLKDDISLGSSELQVLCAESSVYGVNTRYCRHVYDAHLRGARRAWDGTTPLDFSGSIRVSIIGHGRSGVASDLSIESGRQGRVYSNVLAFINRHLDDVFMCSTGIYAWVQADFSDRINELLIVPANSATLVKMLTAAVMRASDVSEGFRVDMDDASGSRQMSV
eukprot:TRINITY_DN9518_c0_g2_i2.p1 TRINITY_DN9518_c0_g2~~TRINITY_DN9518_c0_g2_i2.p1  ORF type:complete len:383 (-),score=39.46 TRINITY_DN9518_c0_g2_i2:145-1293(-)